ncbi:MAG: ATP phosphoribosyltransferase, partial [Eubacteriales bacterium]|nr:ATP phosphoribosyltransferase [Eubacteriales bacterium]
VEVAEFVYARQSQLPVKQVLAVAQDRPLTSVSDLQGKRIATELVQVTKDFLKQHGVEATVEYSFGATEVKVPNLVDAIADLTETGSSLRANNLRVITTILESTTKLHANRRAWDDPWKREKLEDLAVLLLGALRAESQVGLKMNVPGDRINEVLDNLPSMKHPTVSQLYNSDWVAVETILSEEQVRDLIPLLKKAGAQDIVEYPLNKVIP